MSDRDWDAERRDFVADDRDTIADHREREADDREQELDDREQALDERLQLIEQRERELGITGDGDHAGPGTAADDARRARAEARRRRDDARQQRQDAAASRAEAHSSLLASAFADLATDLYQSATIDEVLARIVEAAASVVDGCESASVTFSDGDRHWTAATHGRLAGPADELQHRLGEGPSLAAVDEPVARLGSFEGIDDEAERWPAVRDAWGSVDAAAVLSCGLFLPTATSKYQGALNLYTSQEGAFGPESLDLGRILAAHASVAVATAQEREAAKRMEDDFRTALEGRDVIGQAKGVLMEREGIPADQAFDILRRASQRLNVKLRDLARQIVAGSGTGNGSPTPGDAPGAPAGRSAGQDRR